MTADVLEEVAVAADRIADDQREIARRARAMRRQRDRGRSWSRILDEESSPGLVELLRRSRQHLSSATAAFTAALAAELGREGETRRQIARRLGVTHQRVSALLHHQRRAQGAGV